MGKSPDAFRTISEVAEWLDRPAHVLRFWESKFSQVKPVKRAGGRRYYRPQDMLLLGGIKKLLHEEGMTIKGVQKVLRENGVKHVSDISDPLDDTTFSGEIAGHVEGTFDSIDIPEETQQEGARVLSFPRESQAQHVSKPGQPDTGEKSAVAPDAPTAQEQNTPVDAPPAEAPQPSSPEATQSPDTPDTPMARVAPSDHVDAAGEAPLFNDVQQGSVPPESPQDTTAPPPSRSQNRPPTQKDESASALYAAIAALDGPISVQNSARIRGLLDRWLALYETREDARNE